MKAIFTLSSILLLPILARADFHQGHLTCRNKSGTKTFALLRKPEQTPGTPVAVLRAPDGAESPFLKLRELTSPSEAYPYRVATGYFTSQSGRVAIVDNTVKKHIPGRIWDEDVICERFELVPIR